MQTLKIKSASDLSDIELINRVVQGETDLYEIIMRRYNQRLYRIGRGFFRNNDEEIEDIMQFTYIRAYEKLSSFENRAAFSTWLSRIFINEAIARKKFSGRFMSIVDNDNSAEDEFNESSSTGNPYMITANNELKDLLEKSISDLPEKYRVVFVMHEIENMSVHETGKCLNLTESNVKVRLNRARKMLRENLSQFYRQEEIYSFNLVRCSIIVNNVLNYIKAKNKIN